MISRFVYPIVIVLLIAYVSFYVPKLVERTSKKALEAQAREFDDGLLTRIRENELKINQMLSDSETQLKEIKQNARIVKRITELGEKDISLFRVESGIILLSNKEYPSINSPKGCEANRGIVDKFVKFNRSFTVPPEVLPAFILLDFGSGTDHRLKSEITNVTTTGFTVKFVTWCDTRMSQSKLKWVALGI